MPAQQLNNNNNEMSKQAGVVISATGTASLFLRMSHTQAR